VTTALTPNAKKTLELLNAGKVLSATFFAQEARESGDDTPTELLMSRLGQVAKLRANVLDALPHDTFKCPHSH